jgi:hypothetical protein
MNLYEHVEAEQLDRNMPYGQHRVAPVCASDDQQHKADGAKQRPTLFPWRAVAPVLEVLEFGARKYEAHSWSKVEPSRYVEALGRHAVEFLHRYPAEGLWHTDAESGLPVISHLACNVLFLLAHPASTTPKP